MNEWPVKRVRLTLQRWSGPHRERGWRWVAWRWAWFCLRVEGDFHPSPTPGSPADIAAQRMRRF